MSTTMISPLVAFVAGPLVAFVAGPLVAQFAVAVMAMLAGWTVDLIGIPPYTGLSQYHHDDPSALALACLALLSALSRCLLVAAGPAWHPAADCEALELVERVAPPSGTVAGV